MTINRIWAMPDRNTFDIKPIKELIGKYTSGAVHSVDPFANTNRIAKMCNDIDPECDCEFQMDAIDFLRSIGDCSVDLLLYDPPYSPRQVSEVYKKLGRSVNMLTTSAAYWSDQKKEIGRIMKAEGYVITCGWNSGGIGKKYGFEIEEILMVPHGGWHNDTIVVVEKRQSA